VAACTIPSIEGGLVCVPPCGCAAVGLRRHRAVSGGPRVDDRRVTQALLPLMREQRDSARPCRWPQVRRLRMRHGETGLLRRRDPPPLRSAWRKTSTISSWRNTCSLWGTAVEGVLSVHRVELSNAKARSGWGSMGEVGLPKAPAQGGPELAI
jgi:hypothetical protein